MAYAADTLAHEEALLVRGSNRLRQFALPATAYPLV